MKKKRAIRRHDSNSFLLLAAAYLGGPSSVPAGQAWRLAFSSSRARADRGSGCQGIDLAERGGELGTRRQTNSLNSCRVPLLCGHAVTRRCLFASKKGTAPHGSHTNGQANPSCNRSSHPRGKCGANPGLLWANRLCLHTSGGGIYDR